jgi:hypothetical protein
MGVSSHKYFMIGQCCVHNISHKHFPNGASNPKTNNTKEEIFDLKLKTLNSNKIEYGIIRNLSTMNHF